MRNVVIDDTRLKEMENQLGCTFCENGTFAEMSLELSGYQEKTYPTPGITYGFYRGDVENIRQTVAEVDENWVQYFNEGTHIFCGFEGEKPVSFCIVDVVADCILSPGEEKIGGVGCVGTVPQYRERGIGLRMVDLATVYLKEQGCDVSTISYTHIDQWYGKLGYQTYARFSFFANDEEGR